MRSKMLGFAVALCTFGIGVAATTFWIAYQMPEVQSLESIRVERPFDRGMLSEPPSRESAPCLVPNADAAPPGASRYDRAAISGGVLNGNAVSKPAPVYPPIARAARASGTVVVQVMVDECGNVSSARAGSGFPRLEQAAVDSVMKWRFSPTRLSGQPVRVSGTVTFNFLLQ